MRKNKKNIVVPEKLQSKSITLADEDIDLLRNNEQSILKAKLRIADIELAIIDLYNEKKVLFDEIKFQQVEFISNARKIAVKNGIDPDGDPSKERWNLDTSTMTFNKV